MTTKRLKFSKVKRAAYNPRADLKPEDQEWKDIEASLNEFGYLGGMVVNLRTGNLVAGHQRMAIMQAKGLNAAEFATVDVDDAQERRLNRWDTMKLETILQDLHGQQIDLQHLGLSEIEIKELLNGTKKNPKKDPDAPAPPSTIAIAKPGDLYELWTGQGMNRHRILCGDSTRVDHTTALMGKKKARIIFTDPPYGVSYESQAGTGNGKIANDNLRNTSLVKFLTQIFERAHDHTINKAALYCFYASRNHIEFETAMIEAGWTVKEQLIWAKQMVLGRSDYHWSHEPILYSCKTGHNCEWIGDRTETTLFEGEPPEIDKLTKDDLQAILRSMIEHATIWQEKRDPSQSYLHPTQKPTSLSRRAIRNSTLPGDVVLDLFAGSGSTIIGAELEGRAGHGMELDPCYVDAAVKRFSDTFEDAHAALNGEQYE